MPVPTEFLRGVLGLLCVFFAYVAGRTAGAARHAAVKRNRIYGWVIRATVCGGALLFRHPVDAVVIIVYLLAAAVAGLGWWTAQRPRHEEDLSHDIVPKEDA